jgi:hypothetical protein
MSENAIGSENISKPAPEAAKPKGARKPTKNAKPPKKAGRSKKLKQCGPANPGRARQVRRGNAESPLYIHVEPRRL